MEGIGVEIERLQCTTETNVYNYNEENRRIKKRDWCKENKSLVCLKFDGKITSVDGEIITPISDIVFVGLDRFLIIPV